MSRVSIKERDSPHGVQDPVELSYVFDVQIQTQSRTGAVELRPGTCAERLSTLNINIGRMRGGETTTRWCAQTERCRRAASAAGLGVAAVRTMVGSSAVVRD